MGTAIILQLLLFVVVIHNLIEPTEEDSGTEKELTYIFS